MAAGSRNDGPMSMHGLADVDLPARWARRDEFVILQAGFGQGQRFLATWAAWRADSDRCQRLVYIALDAAPARPEGLNDLSDAAPMQLAVQLAAAWPVMTPGLHTLSFDDGPASGVTLLLGLGEIADLLPQVVARIDAFWLDGLMPPHQDLGWVSRLARLAAPGATAVLSPGAPEEVLQGLALSSFVLDTPLGNADPQGPLVARFEPRHTPPPLAGGLWPTLAPPEQRHALIIGAGLAGCAAAWALARQGWRCTVIDAHAAPAAGASGNPGGLFHSIVHGEDGIHARAHRAAALRTAALAGPWISQGRIAGGCQGLLRLDPHTTADEALALIHHLNLPADYVQWLSASQAADACGIPAPSGGWLFHQGGWLSPASYAQALLDEARVHADVQFIGGCQVHELKHAHQWQAMDVRGQAIAQAPVVVLANAGDAPRLIATLAQAAPLPLSAVRGQISQLSMLKNAPAKAPFMPVAGAGYVLPAHEGQLLFGASSDADDMDSTVRDADHWYNLTQAMQLGCLPPLTGDLPAGITGRVGWRATTPDRLPYVGPVPLSGLPAPMAGRRPPRGDQPRFVPRLRDESGAGVYVLTGLGSRGITWAALAGELLASWVTGSPSLLEASLRDALDPARVLTRARARGEHQADASA